MELLVGDEVIQFFTDHDCVTYRITTAPIAVSLCHCVCDITVLL